MDKRSSNNNNAKLTHTSLSVCHMDLAPRNILGLPDESLCLLDCANAGFYPHVFETAILHLQPVHSKEATFYKTLLGKELSEQDQADLAYVLEVWRNNQR